MLYLVQIYNERSTVWHTIQDFIVEGIYGQMRAGCRNIFSIELMDVCNISEYGIPYKLRKYILIHFWNVKVLRSLTIVECILMDMAIIGISKYISHFLRMPMVAKSKGHLL